MPGDLRGGARARGGRVRIRGGRNLTTHGRDGAEKLPAVAVGDGGDGEVCARGRGVCTRGSRRKRGASASARAGPSRLHLEVPLEEGQIDEYPEGQPMEVPLRPIKKRCLRSPYRTANTEAANAAAVDVDVDLPSKNVGSSDGAGTSGLGEVGGFPCRAQTPLSLGPHHRTESVPSSNTYVDAPAYTTPTTSRNPGRPIQDDEMENILNNGSDLDSDDDEDEVVTVPIGLPRVACLFMETPTDPEPVSEPSQESTESAAAWMSDPMFNFQWLPYPNPPVPPQSRRETFTADDVGPTVSETTPVNIFKCIWDADIMGTVVTETNRYAEQLAAQMLENNSLCPSSRICFWKDTTVEELFTFFGIILAMGVVIKSRITEYWSTSDDIFSTPGFSANMSLKRFQLLSTCLHFRDNSQLPQNINALEARVFKIDPIIKHLNFKFQTMYVMGQNISLDESLLQWRGWLQISRLIPINAASVRIKTYEVCESQTGYLWRFIVHSHDPGTISQPPEQDPLSAFTPSIVLELLEGLQHKGYTVWMDNFYSSPILARKLKRLGFDCVGTLRTNRQFVPAEIGALQKHNMRPGQVTGVTSGDVDLIVWRDHNRVATISTYHGNTVTTDSDGNTKPALIRDYKSMMGGVDKKDQLLSSYPIERHRCRVWYKKLFRRLLNVSVLNSYVIHKKLTHNSMEHREFRYELIKNLLQKGSDEPSVAEKFDVRYHYLAENPFGAESSKGRLRRACKICHKLTTLYCVGCKKSTCLGCFRQLHM